MENSPQKRWCISTKILLGCTLLCFTVFILMIIIENNDFSFSLFENSFVGLIGLLPFLAIVSLIQISLSARQCCGRFISILILAIPCLLFYQTFLYMVPVARSTDFFCGTHLKGIGTALIVYANEYDDILPAQDWSDRLVEEADVSPNSLKCPKANSVEGESDYCLNIHAAGKKLSELPADMVLLFEATYTPAQGQTRQPIRQRTDFDKLKILSEYLSDNPKVYLDKWNQVGGPETLAFDRHKDGCYILFANGDSKYIQLSKLPTLRWNVENTVFFKSPQRSPSLIPAILLSPHLLLSILGFISITAAGVILFRSRVIACWKFAFFLGLLSTVAGGGLGLFSGQAYRHYQEFGGIAGVFFGLLTGLCFASLLAGCPDRIKQLKTFFGFSASVGTVAGILCATLVHLALIIINRETNFFGMLIGIPFGVVAGAVLGGISGFIVKKFYCAAHSYEV